MAAHPDSTPSRRRRPLGALGAVLLAGVLLGAPQAASTPQAPDGEPPWRDLTAAQQALDDRLELIAGLEQQLVAEQTALAQAEELLADLSNQDASFAELLSDAQYRARRLAVEAYIVGGSVDEVGFLLDTDDAGAAAWRNYMLGEHAEAVLDASQSYIELRAAAEAAQVQVAAEIDAARRRVETALLDLENARLGVPDLEYVVWIAQIHAEADTAFARSGRVEPTAEDWSRLRFCEATWNYGVNDGNGFYGAYQFDLTTWVTVGGSGLPSDAPPEEQDARARLLYARRGSQPWPVCGRYLP